MTSYQRIIMACMAAMEAYMNVVSVGQAIVYAFEDEGLKATEEEIGVGLDAARRYMSSDETMEDIADHMARNNTGLIVIVP